MPELPDLEIIREVLAPKLTGQTIAAVEIVRPLVVRDAAKYCSSPCNPG